MLSQLKQLGLAVDGRYATDRELQFLMDYYPSYPRRLQIYQKLQSLEKELVSQVYLQLRSLDPHLLRSGSQDLSTKWKRDTLRVLRYSATAVLVDDAATLEERFLLWFQTIMKAFSAQRSCEVTYAVMQQVIRQYLTPAEAELVLPVLELNRTTLGAIAA